MPYKRRKYPRSKKKTIRKYRKKRWVSRPRAILSGFPKVKVVKLRYVDSNLTLDAGVGLISDNVYKLNDVYDPDSTGAGHQPMGFDQWALIYKHYTVLGAKITVQAKPSTGSNVIPSCFGITLSSESTPISGFSSIDNLLESKLSRGWKISNVSQAGGNTNYPIVTKYFSSNKFFGTKNVVDGAAYGALVTTSPNKLCYASVWATGTDSVDAGAFTALVTIDYIVSFSDPKVLDGS